MKAIYGIYLLNQSVSKQYPKTFFHTIDSGTYGDNWVEKQLKYIWKKLLA